MIVKKGIEMAVATLVGEIKNSSKAVESKDAIAQVASISAGDAEIGSLIADAMDKVGKDGVITVYINGVYQNTGTNKVKEGTGAFGYNAKSDVYEDLVYYLRTLNNPLIILDEAGDLQYEAFLELKALWNATEHCCGWYMMGADGLKEKINRSIDCKKVGYTEMLSRYGGRFSKVTPDDGKEREKFLMKQASIVAKVNAPADADIPTIVRKTQGGLRRVYTEIEKLKIAAENAAEASGEASHG